MPICNTWDCAICGRRECLRQELTGEPDAGNLHVRFEEGGVGRRVWSAVAKPRKENLDTEVYRNLRTVAYSSTLLIVPVGAKHAG